MMNYKQLPPTQFAAVATVKQKLTVQILASQPNFGALINSNYSTKSNSWTPRCPVASYPASPDSSIVPTSKDYLQVGY
jgi:hypothetical protein